MGRIKQMLRSYGGVREELFRELVTYTDDINIQIVDRKWKMPAHLRVKFEQHPNKKGIRINHLVARFSTSLFNECYSINFLYFSLLHEYGHAICYRIAEPKFVMNGHNSELILNIEELTGVKRSIKDIWKVLHPFIYNLLKGTDMVIRQTRNQSDFENEMCATLLACFIMNPMYLQQADNTLYESMLGKALIGDYGKNYRKMTMINLGFNGDDFTTCLQRT